MDLKIEGIIPEVDHKPPLRTIEAEIRTPRTPREVDHKIEIIAEDREKILKTGQVPAEMESRISASQIRNMSKIKPEIG
jgi:hypothetical protein